MPIPTEYTHRYIYHFTHLSNLPGIIANGLQSPNEQKQSGITHQSIALQKIQDRRASMEVGCGPGGVVHDYVPFYLCARSSMLLSVINAKNVDQLHLIYLAVPISVIEREDVIFTNSSANTAVPPAFFSDPVDLAKLDWAAIDSKKWSLGEGKNQARMAEVLIYRQLKIDLVDHLIVWNEPIKKIIEQQFSQANVESPKIVFDGHNNKHHFATAFYENSRTSIVTGPYFIKKAYQCAVEKMQAAASNHPHAKFENTKDLLTALRNDLNALPETAELVGLESKNEVHQENVGDHTLSVVEALTKSEEFRGLTEEDQQTVELSAFLHDIGKGPKSRWIKNDGKPDDGKQQVDPDHPIKSVKMLVRILTEEVQVVSAAEASILAKLVCYHDLVGDILGKGRNPEQLEDIAESERELDMLIALGLADMRSVNPFWYRTYKDEVPPLRDRVLRKLNSSQP